MVTGVSSSVVASSSTASGSSLTDVTVMFTVALFVPPCGSVTTYVNESGPL